MISTVDVEEDRCMAVRLHTTLHKNHSQKFELLKTCLLIRKSKIDSTVAGRLCIKMNSVFYKSVQVDQASLSTLLVRFRDSITSFSLLEMDCPNDGAISCRRACHASA